MFRHTHTRDRSSWQLHMAPKPHPAENVWSYGLSVPWCTPNFMTISWRKYEKIRKSSDHPLKLIFLKKKTSPDIATDLRKPSHLFRSESADSRVHLGGKLQGPPCNWWDPVAGHFLIRLATWKNDMENSMENSVDSIARPFTSTHIHTDHGYSWIFMDLFNDWTWNHRIWAQTKESQSIFATCGYKGKDPLTIIQGFQGL